MTDITETASATSDTDDFEPAEPNPLEVLVVQTIPAESGRIMRGDMTARQLQQELGGTVMQLMADGFKASGEQIDDLYRLVGVLEARLANAVSHLTPEDSDAIRDVMTSYGVLVSELLQGRPPDVKNAEVRRLLETAQAKIEEVVSLLDEITMDDEEDDEDESEDEETSA